MEAAVLDFLLCNVGWLDFTSLRTDGALICRASLGRTTVEPLLGATSFFGRSVFVMEFILSALRRAGFFRGLLGAVLGGWGFAAVAAGSTDAAMSSI